MQLWCGPPCVGSAVRILSIATAVLLRRQKRAASSMLLTDLPADALGLVLVQLGRGLGRADEPAERHRRAQRARETRGAGRVS